MENQNPSNRSDSPDASDSPNRPDSPMDPQLEDFLDPKHTIANLDTPVEADDIDQVPQSKEDVLNILENFKTLTNEQKMFFIKNMGKMNKINPQEKSFGSVSDDKLGELRKKEDLRNKLRERQKMMRNGRKSRYAQNFRKNNEQNNQNNQDNQNNTQDA